MDNPNGPTIGPETQDPNYSAIVLLVDDQAMVGEAVRRLLATATDIDLHYCADPLEAIDQANQITPTVILQDLMLPEIDGFEMVRLFRAHPVTAETPIIVLSTKEDPQAKSRAFAAGANDYLVKLPDRIELIARIRYHSTAYLNRVQRDTAHRALRESQQQLLESNAALISLNQKLEESAASLACSNVELEQALTRSKQVEEALLRAHDELERRVLERTADLAAANLALRTEVAERTRAERRLEHQALHDSLTGLPNRTLLHDRLGQAVRSAARSKLPVALLLMDLDRFKEINDTFGHHCGDLLLQQLRPRLQGALRQVDTVARLGGDEFGIVLPETDVSGAILVARKVCSALEAPFALEECMLDVQGSIGIALYPDHGAEIEKLFRRADVAMYRAKQIGSHYAVYDPAEDQYTARRLSLINDLGRAVHNDEFVLHYQPKISLKTGGVVGVEALIRWQHPQHGFLPPGDFISLAEHTGLIESISLWVLTAALRQLHAWQSAGLDLSMAINLSARNLQIPQLPTTVHDLLRAFCVLPGSLMLEITESAVMADPDHAIANLIALAGMGVRLSIDDFGTGYSSLTYLKRIPVHQVKIDRSFVMDMATNAEDAAIARSVIDLGHYFGLEVVAEGVESQEVCKRLAGMGCDAAQGFYFSRPITAAQFAVWLRERSESVWVQGAA